MAELHDFCHAINFFGGRVFLTGGAVRDMLLDMHNPDLVDYDFEVFDLAPDNLKSSLQALADHNKVVEQKNFPVYKLKYKGKNFDVSIPRRDIKTGQTHNEFLSTPDPNMEIQEAQRRRDFTVNAVYYDPVNDCFYDYFGGIEDLKENILTFVDETTFAEDPLRMWRALQIIARLGFEPSQDLCDLVFQHRKDTEFLSTDELWGEWYKFLTKGRTANYRAAFEYLKSSKLVWVLPELAQLEYTIQDPIYHPEGNVLTHSIMTTIAMSHLCDEMRVHGDQRMMLMLSALCHDFGKYNTTKRHPSTLEVTSPGHEVAGDDRVVAFLDRFGTPKAMQKQILGLKWEHMQRYNFDMLCQEPEDILRVTNKVSVRRFVTRLSNKLAKSDVTMNDLHFISLADHQGRGVASAKPFPWQHSLLFEVGRTLNLISAPPTRLLRGEDLVAKGLKPGPVFGYILTQSYEDQLDQVFDTHEEAILWLDLNLETLVKEWETKYAPTTSEQVVEEEH